MDDFLQKGGPYRVSQSDYRKASPYHLPSNNYYLLTEFAFRTVRYQDQGLRAELARSVRKDRGLNILQYEKQTRLINNLLDGQEMREGQPSLKGFCDLGLSWKIAGSLMDKRTSTGSFISRPSRNQSNVLLTGTLTNHVTAFLIPPFLSW